MSKSEKKSTSNDEIYMVRTYQAVAFEGKQETYFCSKSAGRAYPKKVSLDRDLLCVKIEGREDTILVPLTNVSCIMLFSDYRKRLEAEKEGNLNYETGVNPKNIPRPSKPKGVL